MPRQQYYHVQNQVTNTSVEFGWQRNEIWNFIAKTLVKLPDWRATQMSRKLGLKSDGL